MKRGLTLVLLVTVLVAFLGPLGESVASAPQGTWVYEEDFSTYVYKDYVEDAEWDIWSRVLQLSLCDGITQDYPVVAVDGGGNIVVVWLDGRNGDSDIYAQKLDGNGNRLWVEDVHVNSTSGTASSPAIVVDGSGNIVVVWSSHFDIYAQKLDGSGNRLWTADLRVDSDSGTAWQRNPVVAVDRNGNVVVVWEDSRNGDNDNDIYAQKLDGSGNRLWAADLRVNSNSGMAWQVDPAVAVDGDGNIVVVWEDGRNGDNDIYAQKLDGSGNRLWATDLRVNSDSGMANQYDPAVAVDDGGNIVIVWRDRRNGHSDIYAQQLDRSGNRLWAADLRVNSDSGTASQYGPAVVIDGSGNIVVVWTDLRNGDYDIYAQQLDRSGNRLWVDLRVNSDSGTAGQSNPAVAIDGSGNIVVVWEDERNGDDNIYAQKLDGSGNRLWAADLRVNSNSWAYSTDMAVDGSGNIFVVWYGSDFDIYAQKLDGSGNRLWAADLRVGSYSGPAWQWSPVVTVDGGGNIVVAWYDDRNSDYDYDIYAQKLDGNGNCLWAEDIRVNTESGTAARPAVAVDGGGNIVVVWRDRRNGNGDIYAQRINQIGNKIWLTDMQVVYPDFFYLPMGIAQSQAIDTTADAIHEATLTADVIANGGAIDFYLTNDGGAHWSPVTPGVTHVFTTTGSDLRWRAELTGDPIWRHRTPVVHSLRIEYSTDIPSGDDYESDDTCVQASPLQPSGAVQQHTFHQQDDEDWAWFEVFTGTTYTIVADEAESRADIELALHLDCAASPVYTSTNSLGHEARLTYVADHAGPVWIQVRNADGQVYGEETGYNLSVRIEQPNGLAIVAAGRRTTGDGLQPNINNAANRAYMTFLQRGYSRDDIYYLNVWPDQDVDGNGLQDDVDGVSSAENLREAIQTWARGRGVGLGVPLYIYLVDHGEVDRFDVEVGEQVTAELLNLWLSNLEATTGADQITVIVEACHSGSFIDRWESGEWGLGEISGPNRVIVSSTSSWADAWPLGDGILFSDAFWSGMREGRSVWGSFQQGAEAVRNAGHEDCQMGDTLCQEAWLDDNGNGIPNEAGDGLLAQGRGLVSPLGWDVPEIAWVRVGDVSESGEAVIEAEVRDDGVVAGVEAMIIPPGYEPVSGGDGTLPEWGVPTVTLAVSGTAYVADYGAFQLPGLYRVLVYAWDEEGHTAVPRSVEVLGGRQVYLPLVLRNN